jgi:xylulokinase
MPGLSRHRTATAEGERFALGIDVGTSAVKVAVISSSGSSATFASTGYRTSSPCPGFAEQDPDDWWLAVGSALEQALQAFPMIGSANTVVSLAGQMHTTVLRDANGALIRPAILWSDTRAAEECTTLGLATDAWLPLTGHTPIPAFTSAHLAWTRSHEPGLFDQIATVAVPKDDLRLRLGAGWATEPSDASAMNLMDNSSDTWARDLVELTGLSTSVLAPIVPSTSITGVIRSLPPMSHHGKRLLGTPVLAGAGDQAAQAIALDVVEDGNLGLSVGTSGVAFQCVRAPQPGAFRHALPDLWLALDSTHAAGLALSWWSKVSHIPFDQFPTSALPPAAAPIFLPYLQGGREGGGAPGTLTGLKATHSGHDIASAVLEGVAIELVRLALNLGAGQVTDQPVRVGGRAARIGGLLQLVAAGLGRPCSYSPRGSAFGAAALAATSEGWYGRHRQSSDTTHALVEPDRQLARQFTERRACYDHLLDQLATPQLVTQETAG